jgi:hypothetical protein
MSGTATSTASSSHKPCVIEESLVRAPASALAELRTMTAVMGSPPTSPLRKFPVPCAISSRFCGVVRGCKGPACQRLRCSAASPIQPQSKSLQGIFPNFNTAECCCKTGKLQMRKNIMWHRNKLLRLQFQPFRIVVERPSQQCTCQKP